MYPKVNQHILIDLIDRDHSSRSIVAEVGKKEIFISFPMAEDTFGLLTVDCPIEVSYIIGENQYRFQSKIIGRKKDNISLYRIVKPQENEIERIQRRDNFRVPTNLRITTGGKELTTVNISAGGVLISSPVDLKLYEGHILSGTIYIPNAQSKEIEPISFQGLIKRIFLLDEGRKNIAVQFTVMDDRDQKKVVQYCFDKQRQIRMAERDSR